MDIEKLIERLRTESLFADKASLEIMDLCMEAATALSTLQAENETLQADLEQVKQKYDEASEAICTYCMDVPCRGGSCYWWRGQKEG